MKRLLPIIFLLLAFVSLAGAQAVDGMNYTFHPIPYIKLLTAIPQIPYTLAVCSDCQQTTLCQPGGKGALAIFLPGGPGGGWQCTITSDSTNASNVSKGALDPLFGGTGTTNGSGSGSGKPGGVAGDLQTNVLGAFAGVHGTLGDVTWTGPSTFQVTGGSHITNSSIPSSGLANTTVTPGSYTATNITVNAQGQITSASNGSTQVGFPSTITESAGAATMVVNSNSAGEINTNTIALNANATITTPGSSAFGDTAVLKLNATTSGSAWTVTFVAGTGITFHSIVLGDTDSAPGTAAACGAIPSTGNAWFVFQFHATVNTLTLLGCGVSPPATALSTALGGTGAVSPTAHELAIAEGAAAFNFMAVCGTGSIPYGQAANDPICSTLTFPNAATTGDLIEATGTNALGSLADVAVGQVLKSGGVGVVPAWTANPAVSSIATGTSPPTCTPGTGGVLCANEGTGPTGASTVDQIFANTPASTFVLNHRWGDLDNNGTATMVSHGSFGWAGGSATIAAATTDFVLFGEAPTTTAITTEANAQSMAPGVCLVSNLYVKIGTAANTNVPVFTIDDNTSGQAVTCSVANTATTCNDTTHSFTTAAGDLLSVKVANPTSANSTGVIYVGFQVNC